MIEDTDHGVPDHDEVDMGMEWPLHETTDVRSYRQFYQSWCGAVQGAYPMVKADAIRVSVKSDGVRERESERERERYCV